MAFIFGQSIDHELLRQEQEFGSYYAQEIK